jgi:hypothetical protein
MLHTAANPESVEFINRNLRTTKSARGRDGSTK